MSFENDAIRFENFSVDEISARVANEDVAAEFWAEGVEPPVTSRLAATVTTKTAHASYPDYLANDGNTSTQWIAAAPGNDSWIQLDLGSVKPITRVKWLGAYGSPYPAQSPANYKIQVSNNGSTWVDIVQRSNVPGIYQGDELVAVSARYVRLITTKVSDGNGWSLSLYEFWAEG